MYFTAGWTSTVMLATPCFYVIKIHVFIVTFLHDTDNSIISISYVTNVCQQFLTLCYSSKQHNDLQTQYTCSRNKREGRGASVLK